MERREFLVNAAAGVAAAAGFSPTGRAQAARANQDKLNRIAIMTLNFSNMLKLPGQAPSEQRIYEVFDIPQMYADTYGVHQIEFQHSHIVSTEPSYLKELRSVIEKSKSRMTQINLEFGGMNISAADPAMRLQALDLTKRWVEHSLLLGRPNLMINQGQLNRQNKQYAVETLRIMSDYGKSKGVKISVETRGGGGGRGRAAAPGAAGAAPAPAGPPPERPWMLLTEVIRESGAYANPDMGGIGAADQAELHACLKAQHPMTSGSTHTRVSQVWDLATCVKFLQNELGYKGLYTIEVNGHEGTKRIYDIVLANI
jgi:hypothetical protein